MMLSKLYSCEIVNLTTEIVNVSTAIVNMSGRNCKFDYMIL